MHLDPETIRIQSQLADYCRTGIETLIKGTRHHRLHNYRRLVYNVVDGALEQAYPITYSVLDEKVWNALISDFFSGHAAKSHQIWQMPFEFFEFVQSGNYAESLAKPYLCDLMLFEWKEIEIFCLEDHKIPGEISIDWLADDIPVFNPDSDIFQLTYPVHKKAVEDIQNETGQYYIYIFRNINTGKVHYTEVSALFAALIGNGKSMDASVKELAQQTFKQFDLPFTEEYLNKTLIFLKALQETGGFLGGIHK